MVSVHDWVQKATNCGCPLRPPVGIACHVPPIASMLIHAHLPDHSVPGASWTTNNVMSPARPRQNAGPGPPNGPEVDWQHIAPGSNAFQTTHAFTPVMQTFMQSS